MEETKPLLDWIYELGFEYYGKRDILIKGMFNQAEAKEAIDELVRQGVVIRVR